MRLQSQIAILVGCLICPGVYLVAQTETTPIAETIPIQEMIGRIDEALRANDGLYTGRLSRISKDGDSANWDFMLYKKSSSSLFLFSSKRRGLEVKLLYRDEGDEVWLWDALRAQLYRKRDFEKYEGLFQSGFSYVDLSGYSYQANYNGNDVDQKTGNPMIKLTLNPILEGAYTKVILLANSQESYRPRRMDFFDKEKLLFKTMNFYYDGQILFTRSGKTQEIKNPSRLEILDIKTGSISRLEFFTFDDSISPSDALFDPDFLNR